MILHAYRPQFCIHIFASIPITQLSSSAISKIIASLIIAKIGVNNFFLKMTPSLIDFKDSWHLRMGLKDIGRQYWKISA